MNRFIHSGDLGDVIYALPAIKAMGGGVLHLVNRPVGQMHGLTPDRIDVIAPLLRVQPYIAEVRTVEPFYDAFDLNRFRGVSRNLHTEWLPNHYLDVLGLPRSAALEPWLRPSFPTYGGRPVVIARSARYHNPAFPWKRVMEKYGSHTIFVGTPAEHAAFVAEFGDIRYRHTKDLDELAQRISTCTLFIGNQSAPLAIAEGLKKPIVCEVCPYCPNCTSPRPDFWDGFLPDLENLSCPTPAKHSVGTSTLMPTN